MSESPGLRIGVLTTDTPHHRYFLREIDRLMPKGASLVFALYETKPYPWRERARRHFNKHLPNLWRAWARNPYRQSPALAERVVAFERAAFFPDGDDATPAHLPVYEAVSVNDGEAVRIFDAHPCDLYYVFGTGLVRRDVFERPRLGSVNSHGGLLPGYRGLDTNLWAALLGRPEEMAVTLHEVAEDFDTGAVLRQERIGPVAGLDLVSLRYHTTRLIVPMTLALIEDFVAGRVVRRPQAPGSRYFGPMPHALKLKAGRAIERYAAEAPTAGRAMRSAA